MKTQNCTKKLLKNNTNRTHLQSEFTVALLFLCFYAHAISQPVKLAELKTGVKMDDHHIVRTLNGKLIVLFTDDSNRIFLTEADQGKNWSEPKELGTGQYPSLSMGLDNTIYAIWYENNVLKSACYSEEENEWIERNLVSHSANETFEFPHFAVTKNAVYLTWTVHDIIEEHYRLVYQKFKTRSLDPLSETNQLCSTKFSIVSAIACDLKKNEPVVILYTKLDTLNTKNSNVYICFLYDTDSVPQTKIMDIPSVQDNFMAIPNLAVFNQKTDWQTELGSDIIINFTLDQVDYFYYGEVKFDTTYSFVSISLDSTNNDYDYLYTQPSLGPLFTAVDSDFLFFSSPILVNNQNTIECIQTIDSFLGFSFYYSTSPVNLSEDATYEHYFPQICTEFVQPDSCDGIWFEKRDIGYWLMYNRVPFQYPFLEYTSAIKIPEIKNPHLINDISIFQNYPNPFNSTTKINYTIAQSGEIVIKLFNINGQQVKLIEHAYKSAGTYEIDIDATKLNSGVYFYQLCARDRVETKKLILLE